MIPSGCVCQSCGAGRLHEVAGFARLPRVTSDSKPFRAGGRLFVCEDCGLTQKIADPKWLEETSEIYRDYEMYYQSGGTDQPVFDAVSGRPMGRCEVLSRHLRDSARLPASGKLLDVGAGAGAMIGAFSTAFPGWRLFGLDLDARKEAALRQIPRFERLYTVPAGELGERFDLITLIHSLEHFREPLAMLKTLQQRLLPGGRLFVEVNNVERTAFDLVVADHLCHFSPASLSALLARAGFAIELVIDQWISKEISLLAGAASAARAAEKRQATPVVAAVEADVAWLERMFDNARAVASRGRFGIFGTSVAATWLASGLAGQVEFFVDEDPARQGRRHLERPVLSPAQVPAGAVVYLAFARPVAETIRHRLAALPVKFALPA